MTPSGARRNTVALAPFGSATRSTLVSEPRGTFSERSTNQPSCSLPRADAQPAQPSHTTAGMQRLSNGTRPVPPSGNVVDTSQRPFRQAAMLGPSGQAKGGQFVVGCAPQYFCSFACQLRVPGVPAQASQHANSPVVPILATAQSLSFVQARSWGGGASPVADRDAVTEGEGLEGVTGDDALFFSVRPADSAGATDFERSSAGFWQAPAPMPSITPQVTMYCRSSIAGRQPSSSVCSAPTT